jgi:hypothetical protein
MFSLNKGNKIGVIRGRGVGKKRNKKELFLANDNIDNFDDDWSDSDDEDNACFDNLEINFGLLEQHPNTSKDREVMMVAGPSGSGKSTYSAQYIKKYKRAFPKNEFVLFSRKPEDAILDELNPIRIKLDQSLVDDPVTLEELKDTLVLFDDIDTIPEKDIKKAVKDIQNDILEVGRSYHITCICTSHQICNYNETRILLNECTQFVFFPRAGGTHHITRFLKVYAGLSKKEIQKILKLPSRWVLLNRTYPNYIMYNQGCYALNNTD